MSTVAPAAAASRTAVTTRGSNPLSLAAAGMATRSAAANSASPYSGVTVSPGVVERSGTPGSAPHTRKSKAGNPSAVRSRPKTSQTTPNSNMAIRSDSTTATFDSMWSVYWPYLYEQCQCRHFRH